MQLLPASDFNLKYNAYLSWMKGSQLSQCGASIHLHIVSIRQSVSVSIKDENMFSTETSVNCSTTDFKWKLQRLAVVVDAAVPGTN